jgi:hypothetical protein
MKPPPIAEGMAKGGRKGGRTAGLPPFAPGPTDSHNRPTRVPVSVSRQDQAVDRWAFGKKPGSYR